MYQIDYRKRFAQVAAVALLTCSAVARADNCAGGVDATGNDCNGEQTVRGLSEADSRLLYFQGQAALAELRATRAKQRLTNRAVEVKAAQAELKTAEAELKTAHIALSTAEKPGQSRVAAKAR